MISSTRAHHAPAVNHRRRNWVNIFGGLAVLLVSLGFYFNSRTPADEIRRAEPIEHQGYLGEATNYLQVRVFDPATGKWKEMTKKEVVPGEEFVAINMLFKE